MAGIVYNPHKHTGKDNVEKIYELQEQGDTEIAKLLYDYCLREGLLKNETGD